MDIFRQHPKILAGFSDISFLLSAIHKATGLVTFHGPMLTTLPKSDKESLQSFFATISRPEPTKVYCKDIEILVHGDAQGCLVGGNLASLTHLLGTGYDVPWQDAILFLEDIHEAPYRIDRMLTHLKAAGKLDRLKGVILGQFQKCGDIDIIWERLLNLVDANIPVWGNFPVGHGAQNRTLPIGVQAAMEGNTGTLRILGPCLS